LTELLKQNQYKPMDVAEQVCVIYCGVRGHLDSIKATEVTDFEEKFSAHIKATQQDLLQAIRDAGQLLPEIEEKLKSVITDFVALYKE